MVIVDLYKDFAELTRNYLQLPPTIDHDEVIRTLGWHDLRRLPPQQWSVFYSQELLTNPFYISHQSLIDSIRDNAEKGKDLSQHASTSIAKPSAKDLLLADWGIYHLHPGHGIKPARLPGFVNRAAELLFVFSDNDNLYFLTIMDHNSWTNFHLLRIIEENWPSTIEQYELKGIVELHHDFTEEEIYELRTKSVNYTFRINDKFYIGPGGGVMASGLPFRVLKASDELKYILDAGSKYFIDAEETLRIHFARITKSSIKDKILYLKLTDYNPREGNGTIIEQQSQALFDFQFR